VSPAEDFFRPVFCWLKEAPMSASKSDSKSASADRKYRPETRLVHAGTLRSQFGETSVALFLTQGFVYDTAASAERRFKNEEPGYQYSRFSNPTVSMFEARMAAFEGAESARATATGMAAVTTAIMGQLRAGDHIVAAKALFARAATWSRTTARATA
jgi:O-succinylhomoserine sulfhydrylase